MTEVGKPHNNVVVAYGILTIPLLLYFLFCCRLPLFWFLLQLQKEGVEVFKKKCNILFMTSFREQLKLAESLLKKKFFKICRLSSV